MTASPRTLPAELIGSLRDRAAALVTLADLLSSRRVGPKLIQPTLPSAADACAEALEVLPAVSAALVPFFEEDAEGRAALAQLIDRTIATVTQLAGDVAACSPEGRFSAADRLALERGTVAAAAAMTSTLAIVDLFAAASEAHKKISMAPPPMTGLRIGLPGSAHNAGDFSVHVADVLMPPVAPEPSGGQLIRATVDASPLAATRAAVRVVRALVELGLQIADTGENGPLHVEVRPAPTGGPIVRILERSRTRPEGTGRELSSSQGGPVLVTRRIAWAPGTIAIVRVAAKLADCTFLRDLDGLMRIVLP